MKKILIFVILILVAVCATLIFDQKIFMKKEDKNTLRQNSGQVREPAVAGQFYPGTAEELSSLVDEYLSRAEVSGVGKYVRALIVPHAGYSYSGWVAAYGFKTLIGQDIKTVVLIGNSHNEYFDGVSVYPKGYYKTPLGNVEIDAAFVKRLMAKSNKISYHESADNKEHSLEVQLPFLQKVLTPDWKLVPIVLGNQAGSVDILINALKDLIDENTLIIASSDLSHYPKYEDAKYSDGKVIEAILSGKRENLRKTISDLEKENIPNLQTCACGHDSIGVVMGLMEGRNAKLLKYANSGDVSIGDPPAGEAGKSQVVGYAAIVFSGDSTGDELSKAEQKRLLEIARDALETYVKTGKIPEFENEYSALEKHLGAFVTLRKDGGLRGCIGIFSSDMPLYKVVAEMAVSAARHDSRFYPVSESELKDLEYEVSVLSPLKKVDSWKDVEIGKHGVEIIGDSRRGVFLPQVATENNWDRETFLSVLCTQKAGLPADCYKDPETEIYIFTAQVFSEK
jgi:AmmeMemoRadiSam system protein B/AmmeMemoRadiSam system protein A